MLSNYFSELTAGNSPNEDIAARTQDWLSSLDSVISPMLWELEDQAQAALAEAHELRLQLAATGALLHQSRESAAAADAGRIEEANRRAVAEDALAQAQRQFDADAELRRLEQEAFSRCAEEANQRAAGEAAAFAQALTRYEGELAHARRLEVEAGAAHAATVADAEARFAELNAALAAARETENARTTELDQLRAALADQLNALSQAQEHQANTLLEMNSLRKEAALSAADRGHVQGEMARLQADLSTERQLVASQASALAGYQRSILYRSRDILLRARASIRGRRRG